MFIQPGENKHLVFLSLNAGRLQGDGVPPQVEIVGEAQLEGGFGHVLHRYRVGRIKAGIVPPDKADARP